MTTLFPKHFRITPLLLIYIIFLSCAGPGKKSGKVDDEISLERGYTHFSLATIHEQEGRIQEAINEYEIALSYEKNSTSIIESLLRLYRQINNYEKVLELARKGVQLEPQNPNFREYLGDAYARKGKIGKAIEEYEILMGLEPEVTDYLYTLAHLHQVRKEYDKTVEYLSKFVEKNDYSPYAHLSLGRVYERMGENEKAYQEYLRTLEIDSTFHQGYWALGSFFEARGEWEKSLENYQRVLSMDPNNVQVKRQLIDLHIQMNQDSTAIEISEELLQLLPRDRYALQTLGLLYLQQGDLQKAENQFFILTGLDPEDRDSHYYLGRIFYSKHMYIEALKQMNRTLQIDPNYGEAWVYLALISENIEELSSKVPQYLKKAERFKPDNKYYYTLLGMVYSRRNENRKALGVYRDALKLWKDDADLWYRIGITYDRLKNFDETVRSMRKAIQLDPQLGSAYNYVGYLYAERGIRLTESLLLIEKALEIEPDNGFYIDSLGWVYFKMGRIADAIRELERAASIREDPVILEHLGDVYYEMGRTEDARTEWNKSLKLNSNNEDLIEKIQKNK
jgi:tetratricopeptide (TPR) repeat protein